MLTLSGCGTLQVPVTVNDLVLYQDQGTSGATTVDFLTHVQKDIDLPTWNSIRTQNAMVCEMPQDWANIDNSIGQLCSQVVCDYQLTQALHAFNAFLKGKR